MLKIDQLKLPDPHYSPTYFKKKVFYGLEKIFKAKPIPLVSIPMFAADFDHFGE